MYNRYIPQPDGSFRRSRMPECRQPQPPPAPVTSTHPQEPVAHPEPIPIPKQNHHRQQRNSSPRKPQPCGPNREETSAIGFLRKLLPKEFDTGDLMIVLLLLLMAGDCTEDRNTALLTLALYFFM